MDIKEGTKEIERIARVLGGRPDFVQGGGGNISVKGEGKMAIKASGYRLEDVQENVGIVMLREKESRAYYEGTLWQEMREEEAFGKLIVDSGGKSLRPSIETGFHALLDNFVIHTHSVYGNVFACAKEGRDAIKHAGKKIGAPWAWIPYCTPGIPLAEAIREEKKKRQRENIGVWILENHGVITTAESASRALGLHDALHEALREGGEIGYPEVRVVRRMAEAPEGGWKSGTEYIREMARKNPEYMKKFQKAVLFPDQEVFCGDMAVEENGEIYYRGGEAESLAKEETLVAWLYIMEEIARRGWSWQGLPEEERRRLREMESEKARVRLMKGV